MMNRLNRLLMIMTALSAALLAFGLGLALRAPADGFLLLTGPGRGGYAAENEGRININRAALTELTDLPGIGPALAARIAESRLYDGFFETPEDLLRVKGIGEKTLEKLLPYITVEDEENAV